MVLVLLLLLFSIPMSPLDNQSYGCFFFFLNFLGELNYIVVVINRWKLLMVCSRIDVDVMMLMIYTYNR